MTEWLSDSPRISYNIMGVLAAYRGDSMPRFLILAFIVCAPLDVLHAGPSSGIYWTAWYTTSTPDFPSGHSKIWRAELDGSNPKVIVDRLNTVWPVTVDVSTHKIYWGVVNGPAMIQRANLDGTSVETVVSGSPYFIDNPAGLVIDTNTQQLYWTDFARDKISVTDLATFATADLMMKPGVPLGMDLDTEMGLMYWVNASTDTLRRVSMNAGDIQSVLEALNNPRDLKLDLESGKVYWAELGNGIWRADLSGANTEQVVFPSQNNLFQFFDLDMLEHKLYWKAYDGLVSTDLDGSKLHVLIPRTFEGVAGDRVQGIAVVHDCNENFIDDVNELPEVDCNQNDISDECEYRVDVNGDGLTALDDFEAFLPELAGPTIAHNGGCDLLFDADHNGYIDLRDFGFLQRAYSRQAR